MHNCINYAYTYSRQSDEELGLERKKLYCVTLGMRLRNLRSSSWAVESEGGECINVYKLIMHSRQSEVYCRLEERENLLCDPCYEIA